jgi:hypothetical protein
LPAAQLKRYKLIAMNDLISKNEYTFVKLKSLIVRRSDQISFHIFSEANMRGQIYNLKKRQHFELDRFDGNLLITGIKGTGHIFIGEDSYIIEELDQILINPKVPFSILAKTDASFQFVWSPPFAKTEN